MPSTRRSLLTAFLTLPLIDAARMKAFAQAAPELPLTLACDDGDHPTPEREAGPFFRPNSPLNRDLYPDAPGGERITVAGFVLDNRCRPLGGSLVEIWHADENGDYDSVGFRLRGHQFTDTQGRWWFNTIVPAFYPGRTRHFHLKVQRPGGPVLTTQLYFPREPRNAGDRLFDEALLLDMKQTSDGKFGRFDFVI
ncbi:intradiol ring-cleavage dioxygenase [Rhizobium lentis]|uniref:dioxygenase family protein n=1 Tax=Rhizobium lentis TaxID=1138194 RepID=UPI001C84034C|nr:intradiol ring-cleavage dioxygenase [Rhizobium lentis]MBX4957530.1 intradiol ring-cleavage dioxygenase [Rhizobium lentis]MBX4974048.1 intradiol ring-cleavage dioxygenase [Rhizobium lentis]MBX4987520.1 intradiol ring-cleavage dioxygenase [Rhizobium lentis]MBX5005965.1 intradiol ring-cleavage dioxygenase [Rhizobium lentis]MBX5030774.1 intradiol ring-cleavage dioxygenase [Rhizobium lentis]